MFKNMKIGMRLGLGFGLMLALLAAIAMIGIMRLSALNADIDDMVKDKYPKTLWANNINASVNVIGRAMRNMLIMDKREQVEKELGRVQDARKNIKENLDKLDATIRSDKGKELLKAIADARGAYVGGQDQFLKLIADGKQGEAKVLLLTEVREKQNNYFKAVSNLIDYQGSLMEGTGKAAGEAYQAARSLMIALGLAAALLGAAIAFWVTRSITRPLNQAVSVANQLAEGDLNARIDVDSRDETGMLLAAMKNMVEKLSQIITEVRSAADNLSSASEEVSATAQSLSQASSEQAASVEETSASVE
ncbi:MAG: methyl-accepting chemotaxis protein, partial [Sulfuricella denitrificans]|nr:methyl-accepting chemotaxis protein [Sulfuricella denitrificans]